MEIAVTHPVDQTKRRVVRKLNVAMLQIRLTADDAARSRAELKDKLAGCDRCAEWIFNPRQRDVEREWIEQLRRVRRNARAAQRAAKEDFVQFLTKRRGAQRAKRPPKDDAAPSWREWDAWAYGREAAAGAPPSLEQYQRRARRGRLP